MIDLPKTPSGIRGLDELTFGGLPRGRPTLVCGGPGCGKTLLALTFLVKGATVYDEPGVFLSFDERISDLEANMASLGYDLATLQKQNLLSIDHVHLDRHTLREAGDYNLEALFIRLDHAVKQTKAKRVALDSIDTLFAGVPNAAVVRSELARLFNWLKDKALSAIITAERQEGGLTRHGIEEYISDCVIVLDHRIVEQLSTRRLRVVKYRGSTHGTNEYPFLIGRDGITVLPVTSAGLAHIASDERVSSGLEGLDAMLEGKGFFKGSSVLLGGGPGTGKTSIAANFVDAACRRGERCTYFLFEESTSQLSRNMRSIGLNLRSWIDQGLLHCIAVRPTLQGLETHLSLMIKEIDEFHPAVVVIDPLSAFSGSGNQSEQMILRLIDHFKAAGVTTLLTSLQGDADSTTDFGISSLVDTWMVVRNARSLIELERRFFIVKSRGMAHSACVRKLEMSNSGLRLTDVAGDEPDRAAA